MVLLISLSGVLILLQVVFLNIVVLIGGSGVNVAHRVAAPAAGVVARVVLVLVRCRMGRDNRHIKTNAYLSRAISSLCTFRRR